MCIMNKCAEVQKADDMRASDFGGMSDLNPCHPATSISLSTIHFQVLRMFFPGRVYNSTFGDG